MKIKDKKTKIVDFILKIIVIILAIIVAFPLYLTFISVFKPTADITSSPISIPIPPMLDNLKSVLLNPNVNIGKMYFNSICITVFGAGICILISSMAGYYVARVKSRFGRALFIFFLFGMMVPYIIIYVPLVTMFNKLGITGNLPVLIMVFVSGSISFSVFMYQGFISGISEELEEAAIIDGAGQMKVFFRIIMPLVKPCTTTVAIFIGLSMWNDFLTPLLIGQVQTITVGIYTAIGPYASDWGTVFAYVALASFPIVIAYILAQKQFINGLTSGALKG